MTYTVKSMWIMSIKGGYEFTECLFSNMCFPCDFCYVCPFKNPLDLRVNDSAGLFDSFIAKTKRAPRQQQILWEVHWLLLVELEMFCLRPAESPGNNSTIPLKTTKQQRNSLDLLD